jgi:hypothetical protein
MSAGGFTKLDFQAKARLFENACWPIRYLQLGLSRLNLTGIKI